MNHNVNFDYIEGCRDPQYGGIITDVCKLPVGTTFFVRNGCWAGTICEDEKGLYIHIVGCKPKRFKREDKYLLSINVSEESREEEIFKLDHEVVIKNVISVCSVCKNKDTKECKKCEISKENIIPNNFLADVSKVTPYFVDSYYELLNQHVQLFHRLGLNTRIEKFELGD